MRRCYDPSYEYRYRYGGRGIVVYKEWHDTKTFCEAMIELGWQPGMTIDREDNDGNYEPGNIRIATRKEQARNTHRNVWLSLDGERHILTDWAVKLGVNYRTLQTRLKKGWSEEKTLTAPVFKPSSQLQKGAFYD